jgi:triphosphoribosyl-dephospho-CoA synthase
VEDPPEGLDDLDVRRGAAAAPALRDRGLTLEDVMELSAGVDGIAAEWVGGFERTFEAAGWLLADEGPVPDRTSRAFLRLLADEVDTFVVKTADGGTAEEVTRRARAVLDGEEDAEDLAEELVDRGINPGTTADLTAGALFIALERGLVV